MLQSAYISIISGASLWGLIALFFKFLTACGFSPLQIVALRVLFAAVLMTAVIFKIDPKLLKIRWRDSWLFIGTGIFSLVFFNYCYFRSIESSSISIAVLLLYFCFAKNLHAAKCWHFCQLSAAVLLLLVSSAAK